MLEEHPNKLFIVDVPIAVNVRLGVNILIITQNKSTKLFCHQQQQKVMAEVSRVILVQIYC